MKTLDRNKSVGKTWEDILFRRAQSNGLTPLRNHLTARMIRGGGVQVVKSELDFTLIRRRFPHDPAVVGFFDAKCFEGEFLTHSMLLSKKGEGHQIERAALYNSLGVPAGFICWLRKAHQVIYLPGSWVERAVGERFDLKNSVCLGPLETFDLRLAMEPHHI